MPRPVSGGAPVCTAHLMLAARTPSTGLSQRLQELLDRLRPMAHRGEGTLKAAEELDRLLPALGRAGLAPDAERQIRDLCAACQPARLPPESAQAWLTLVGALRLAEYTPQATALATDPGRPGRVRSLACTVLAGCRGEAAAEVLAGVAATPGDVSVRTAAATALAGCGRRGGEELRRLTEELDLPRPVWQAAVEARERLQ